MMECDPCRHCKHYSESYPDRFTGLSDEGCDAEEEFALYDGQRPCPYFQAILPSDGLFEQLACEEEQRWWEQCVTEEWLEKYAETHSLGNMHDVREAHDSLRWKLLAYQQEGVI